MPSIGTVLERFIERLTDAYDKAENSNVYKLAKLTTQLYQEIEDTYDRISEWNDLDKAEGAALDKAGQEFKQNRGATDDNLYRVLIKAKIKRSLSDGTIDALIDFISFLLQVSPTEINVRERWEEFYSDNILPPFSEWALHENTRMEMASFAGKVFGSSAENPHVAKVNNGVPTALLQPSAFNSESELIYSRISALDGQVYTLNPTNNLYISQVLFSFDMIEHVTRKYGSSVFGGATTTAQKVAWIKANIDRFALSIWGRGSGPSGNKFTGSMWSVTGAQWLNHVSHTNAAISKVGITCNQTLPANYKIPDVVDANGFIHFIAHAEAANGTIASSLFVDYTEIEIYMKEGSIPIPQGYELNIYQLSTTYGLSNYEFFGLKEGDKLTFKAGTGTTGSFTGRWLNGDSPVGSSFTMTNNGSVATVTLTVPNGVDGFRIGAGALAGVGRFKVVNPMLQLGSVHTGFKPIQTDFASGHGSLHVDAPAGKVAATGLTLRQFGTLINLVTASGVSAGVMFEGTFSTSSQGAVSESDPLAGFADVGQTTGGYLGASYDPGTDSELPL